MDQKRIFRPGLALLVVGAILCIVGVGVTVPYAAHLLAGTPMTLSNGKYHIGTHIASPGEMAAGILYGAFFATVGTAMMIGYLNCTVETDSTGILSRSFFRTVARQFQWPDIERVDIRKGNKGAILFQVCAQGQIIEFGTNYSNFKDLLSIVQTNCRALDFSTWSTFMND